MTEEEEPKQLQFRFRWRILAQTSFTFANGNVVSCLFSRAVLRDNDLFKELKQTRSVEKSDAIAEGGTDTTGRVEQIPLPDCEGRAAEAQASAEAESDVDDEAGIEEEKANETADGDFESKVEIGAGDAGRGAKPEAGAFKDGAEVGTGVTGREPEAKAGNAGREAVPGAEDTGREADAGAKDVGREGKAEAGDIGREVEAGAKDVGREAIAGAKDTGREAEAGAEENGHESESEAAEYVGDGTGEARAGPTGAFVEGDASDSCGGEEQFTCEEECELMRRLHLPTSFGKRRKSDRQRDHSDALTIFADENWMRGLSFEEYWESVGDFVVNKTFLADFGSLLDASNKDSLMERLVKSPESLIEEHVSLKDYANVVASCDSDFKFKKLEELWYRHAELVCERARRDFNEHKKRRILTGSSLIQRHGFVLSDASCFEREDCPEAQREESRNNDAGDCDPQSEANWSKIEDIYITKDSACLPPKPLVIGSDSQESLEEDSKVGQECTSNGDEGSVSIEREETEDFDFGFDPERDASLVGKNAEDAYSHDKVMGKYWRQRYRLFSKFESGVLLDREGWFSVTPERIAEHIADRMVLKKDAVIVDAFAGVGGNCIQMALKGAYVIAIDMDPVRLRCAAQNARVYGVYDRIEFVCMDFFHFADSFELFVKSPRRRPISRWKKFGFVDAVFLSPPWGGPSYLKSKVFDLEADMVPDGTEIFHAAQFISSNVALFMPRQTDVAQLIALAGGDGACEVEQNVLMGKVKSITAYYGNLVAS